MPTSNTKLMQQIIKAIKRDAAYVLLGIFSILLLYVVIRDRDIMLLVIGSFFIFSGISAVDANNKFGDSIERYREAGDNLTRAFDEAIKLEKKKTGKAK